MPGDGLSGMIAVSIPCGDFGLESGEVSNAALKGLACEGGEFDFSHVEPGAMFGGMVDFEAREEFSGFIWRESRVEGSGFVGVEVVAHEDDFFGFGIAGGEQVFDLVRPIDHSAMFLGGDGAFSGQRFAEHKDAGGATSFVFMVVTHWFSGLWR